MQTIKQSLKSLIGIVLLALLGLYLEHGIFPHNTNASRSYQFFTDAAQYLLMYFMFVGGTIIGLIPLQGKSEKAFKRIALFVLSPALLFAGVIDRLRNVLTHSYAIALAAIISVISAAVSVLGLAYATSFAAENLHVISGIRINAYYYISGIIFGFTYFFTAKIAFKYGYKFVFQVEPRIYSNKQATLITIGLTTAMALTVHSCVEIIAFEESIKESLESIKEGLLCFSAIAGIIELKKHLKARNKSD
ncbi:phosphoethanolamine transferase CptA [Cohnella sp. GbtcB17]|uniref:phosphoethanolamine transferase CptA n=1 Tax=Cohnella sp. GbtcB17 TaxID=2824762 RepID=UPI001C2F9E92|nr:phosphoethanolamine transferase CptA [Cohnella sp. GbtcB17]